MLSSSSARDAVSRELFGHPRGDQLHVARPNTEAYDASRASLDRFERTINIEVHVDAWPAEFTPLLWPIRYVVHCRGRHCGLRWVVLLHHNS